MKIKVIGIDPALRNFGFAHAVVDVDSGEVTIEKLVLAETASANKKTAKVVRKNSDDLNRAQILHDALVYECSNASFAFVEVPVGSQNARSMASYGICIGVLTACPIPMIQLTPAEVKMVATGDKQAAKEEMVQWATNLHPEANWLTRKLKGKIVPLADNEHLADAVAAVYAGLQTDQFKQAMALLKSVKAA